MKKLAFILFAILLVNGCTGSSSSSEESNSEETAIESSRNYECEQEEREDEQDDEYELPDVETPPYSYDDEEEMSEEERYFAHFSNFEPSYSDIKGVVVYEGQGDYYVIETTGGYVIAERYMGILYEGHTIYGQLHSYGFKYCIDLNRDSEVKLYIEDYMLSKDRAVEWMGEHGHLKYYDQSRYNEANNDW